MSPEICHRASPVELCIEAHLCCDVTHVVCASYSWRTKVARLLRTMHNLFKQFRATSYRLCFATFYRSRISLECLLTKSTNVERNLHRQIYFFLS